LSIPNGNIELSNGKTLEVCEPPPRLLELSRIANANGSQMSEFRVWESRGLSDVPYLHVLATHDVTPRWGPLLHVSVSTSREYLEHPPWDDLLAIRAAFFPSDRDAMMVLPREADYINIHPNTWHLWEAPETWGLR
jgi:hypothetical protein